MRIIISCDEQHIEKAWQAFREEQPSWQKRYDKPGWGWHFGMNPRFFIRGIKGGLSIGQVKDRP